MEEIVADDNDDNDDDTMALSELQTLEMAYLPKLKGICAKVLISNALESFTIDDCHQLKKLPFSMHNLPCALKEINVSSKYWWDALEWDHPQTKDHFQHCLHITKF